MIDSSRPTRRRFLVRAAASTAVIAGLQGARLFPAAQAASVTLTARGPQPVTMTLNVNGQAHTLALEPRVTLLDALRERLELTGTKKGCDQGTCGACTVLVDGKRVNACFTLAIMTQGRSITTIEGLARGGVSRARRLPVRLLHARPNHVGGGAGKRKAADRQRGRTRVDERQHLPLRGVSEYRCSRAIRCGRPGVNPFRYAQATDAASAVTTLQGDGGMRYIAGGTNILDLMKDDVERPTLLLDITHLPLRSIESSPRGVRLGALATMADVADAPAVKNGFPVVSAALLAGASPQLRNMATIGGNIMQRTRCAYFRDVSQACNKRVPGRGCAAIGGQNRNHGVIGTSDYCICTHPSDLAVALMVVDAVVHARGAGGSRAIPFEQFHVLPGETPNRETVLEHGDLIEAIELPASVHARNSAYVKVRDRASYEFALVSVAAALDMPDGIIRTARIAIGGVAPKPWRSHAAEAALIGRPATPETFAAAGIAASAGMHGYGKNDFKLTLTRRTVVRALEHAGGLA
jgi:xanthine dehydrogenase YagS FAD-binding subunit